jgi:alpha-3'-ketoglucosidase
VRRNRVAGLIALALSSACSSAQEAPPRTEIATTLSERPNTLSAEEREAGWELLFDGSTMSGWRGYNRDDLPAGWVAQDGMLTRSGEGGDIISDRQFTDFDLTVEWRVEASGNSGIFYRAAEGEEWIYHSAPEMQVLDDDGHRDGQNPLTSAGANYGLHAAPRGVVHAAGEWNIARIVVEGSHVEHWLNGDRIVEYDLGSLEWKALVAASKFGEWPAYGRAERGHIGLQDHGDPVWYRNMKIREIR